VPLIVDAYMNGELILAKLRGRSCYSEFTQAAEYYLRKQSGDAAVAAYRHLKTEELSSNQVVETFVDTSGTSQHALTIESRSDLMVFTSCNDQDRSPVTRYQLVNYQVSRNR
jgi:hypothetical protein